MPFGVVKIKIKNPQHAKSMPPVFNLILPSQITILFQTDLCVLKGMIEKMIKNVFFDLDGTLTDSREGIINGFEYALRYFGIQVEDRKYLEKFIGPSLAESFKAEYKFDEEKTKLAVAKYREYYSTRGLKENKLYAGIKELITDLANNNINIILATAKPQIFAEQILEDFEIKKYFKFISGATLDGSRLKKGDIIKYAIDNLEQIKLEECIMVGDRRHDIEGAKENSMKSIGVTYGFGSEEELKTAGADYIAHNAEELKKYCLNEM